MRWTVKSLWLFVHWVSLRLHQVKSKIAFFIILDKSKSETASFGSSNVPPVSSYTGPTVVFWAYARCPFIISFHLSLRQLTAFSICILSIIGDPHRGLGSSLCSYSMSTTWPLDSTGGDTGEHTHIKNMTSSNRVIHLSFVLFVSALQKSFIDVFYHQIRNGIQSCTTRAPPLSRGEGFQLAI